MTVFSIFEKFFIFISNNLIIDDEEFKPMIF